MISDLSGDIVRNMSIIATSLVLAALLPGLTADIAEPFKVGAFEIDGAPTVGIVLRDSLIVELNAAYPALEKSTAYPQIPLPANMIELIGTNCFIGPTGNRWYQQSVIAVSRDIALSYSDKSPFCCENIWKKSD